LTSRRVSEVLKLKKEDVIIEEMKIISKASISKTNTEYHFPFPSECLDYIQSIENGLLFPTLKRSSLHAIFIRLLNLTDIKFYNEKSLSLHDTRRLLMSIMITKCKIDATLADSCISHAQKGTIKSYLFYTFKDIEEAFEKYWQLIREEAKLIDLLDT
jgi:integrase